MTNRINILLRLNCVGIRRQKIPTSMNSNGLFLYNGDPEGFLLFVRNFNISLEASDVIGPKYLVGYT